MQPIEVIVSRFWLNVERHHADACWPWAGPRQHGYGIFWDGERNRPAHQMALTYATGESRPMGFDTCHSADCATALCCNPRHLRYARHGENTQDSINAGTHAVRKLIASDARDIRVRHSLGARPARLAEQYGVREQTIQRIIRGERWSTAGGPIKTKKEAANASS